MRQLLLCFFLAISSSAFAQHFWSENFDNPSSPYRSRFVKDTTHNNNIWQIGKPQKTVFSAAASIPNAIVTDTLNPYPINDTSIFIIKHQKFGFFYLFTMHFDYKLDIDSTEKLMIEVSGDTGHHWVNVLTEDTVYDFGLPSIKPDLQHSTNGWKTFTLDMSQWAHTLPGGSVTYPSYATADTILFRFTFISDGIQTNKDGWMMDNFQVTNATIEAVPSPNESRNAINVWPNPARNRVTVYKPNTVAATIKLYSADGRLVYQNADFNTKELDIPLVNYEPGMYFIEVTEKGNAATYNRVMICGQ